jgi:mono/diheme cytochrome c family protein
MLKANRNVEERRFSAASTVTEHAGFSVCVRTSMCVITVERSATAPPRRGAATRAQRFNAGISVGKESVPEGRLKFSRKLFRLGGRTFYPKTLAAIILLALASPFLTQAQKPATVTADLPAGAMQAKATTACLECHEARIILQQRLTKPAWTKEVDKMTKWGAVVDPADRDALIDYLSANFSPEKPAYDPPRTSDNAGSGKSSK